MHIVILRMYMKLFLVIINWPFPHRELQHNSIHRIEGRAFSGTAIIDL